MSTENGRGRDGTKGGGGKTASQPWRPLDRGRPTMRHALDSREGGRDINIP